MAPLVCLGICAFLLLLVICTIHMHSNLPLITLFHSNTFQLAAKLLAAHVWTSGLQPIAVLTDLVRRCR